MLRASVKTSHLPTDDVWLPKNLTRNLTPYLLRHLWRWSIPQFHPVSGQTDFPLHRQKKQPHQFYIPPYRRRYLIVSSHDPSYRHYFAGFWVCHRFANPIADMKDGGYFRWHIQYALGLTWRVQWNVFMIHLGDFPNVIHFVHRLLYLSPVPSPLYK